MEKTTVYEKNEGLELHVTPVKFRNCNRYGVTLFDVDAGEYLNIVKIFKTKQEAHEYAKEN